MQLIMKGGLNLKKHLLKLIGICSILMSGLVAGAAKTFLFYEPKSN